MKRIAALTRLLALLLAPALAFSLAACGAPAAFDGGIDITVVSREDGSGTRGAFVELFGLEEEQPGGQVYDMTTFEAVTINNTAVMMSTVESNPYAVGYISFGSLNDGVKAVEIDGVAPTAENILNGSYPIARPFLIATKADLSGAAAGFIGFILSAEGQAVVAESGYIPLAEALPYSGGAAAGKIVVAGSSSVNPVMEKLKEAYLVLSPGAEIEIQQSDSSTGMSAVQQGICDIGMASRGLKESEEAAGLVPTTIAMDGIAVIVNRQNPADGLSKAQVKAIFSGEAKTWAEARTMDN